MCIMYREVHVNWIPTSCLLLSFALLELFHVSSMSQHVVKPFFSSEKIKLKINLPYLPAHTTSYSRQRLQPSPDWNDYLVLGGPWDWLLEMLTPSWTGDNDAWRSGWRWTLYFSRHFRDLLQRCHPARAWNEGYLKVREDFTITATHPSPMALWLWPLRRRPITSTYHGLTPV